MNKEQLKRDVEKLARDCFRDGMAFQVQHKEFSGNGSDDYGNKIMALVEEYIEAPQDCCCRTDGLHCEHCENFTANKEL